MRGEANASVLRGKPKLLAHDAGEKRILRWWRGPNAFVEASEDHQIAALQARFEQAPDGDARVAGGLHRRDLVVIHQAQQHARRGVRGDEAKLCAELVGFTQQTRRALAVAALPDIVLGEAFRGLAERVGEGSESDLLLRHDGHQRLQRICNGLDDRAGARPVLHLVIRIAFTEIGEIRK